MRTPKERAKIRRLLLSIRTARVSEAAVKLKVARAILAYATYLERLS